MPPMDFGDYKPTADLSRAGTIPARWYIDPRFLDAERDRVFARTWQPVGHAADVSQPGDYFACEVLGEPIVVVRGKDNVVRAFSNVCRHRASTIAEGKGHAAALLCPYHGWSYSLDGRLTGQPEFEGVEDWDKNSICLPALRVAVWGPFVFVNSDPDAPSLSDVLAEIPNEIEKLGCAWEQMRFSQRRDYVINCNWKVYVDNYLEGYHLPVAHPGLFRELDYTQYRVDTHRYHSSQFAPIRPRRNDGKPRRYDADSSGPGALYYWIFPNFMLNVYPDNISSNIILPTGPDKTLTIFEWFSYGEVAVGAEAVAFSDEIQQEDIKICEAVERGLHSRTYDRGRFSVKRENGVHHFHLLLHEFLTGR